MGNCSSMLIIDISNYSNCSHLNVRPHQITNAHTVGSDWRKRMPLNSDWPMGSWTKKLSRGQSKRRFVVWCTWQKHKHPAVRRLCTRVPSGDSRFRTDRNNSITSLDSVKDSLFLEILDILVMIYVTKTKCSSTS